MICPYCKKEIPNASYFCPECGQTITQVNNSSPNTNQYWDKVTRENEAAEKQKKAELGRIEKARKAQVRNTVLGLLSLLVIGIVVLFFTVIKPNMTYKEAKALMEVKKYTEAAELFESIIQHKDAADQVRACRYFEAELQFTKSNYEEAASLYNQLGDYKDAVEKWNECQYIKAVAFYESQNYVDALKIFEELGDYKDSLALSDECRTYFWEIESNNTFETATRISLNMEYFGFLQSEFETEQDWYAFSLDNPGRVYLIFNSENQNDYGAYWDVSIRSKSDPAEDLWQEYIDGDETRTTSETLSLSEGTYYVEIESSDYHSKDPYSIEIVYEEN